MRSWRAFRALLVLIAGLLLLTSGCSGVTSVRVSDDPPRTASTAEDPAAPALDARYAPLALALGVSPESIISADPVSSASVTVTFSIAAAGMVFPVYRFYNPSNGTHFYTASLPERNDVMARLSHIFKYEGEAYRLNTATNSQPLYRFYMPSKVTHFYTASAVEKSRVQSTLSHIYTYEGIAYNVNTAPRPGAITVWRFFNRQSGTHFYTASPVERNSVQANLSHIYTLEGPAFYLGQ